MKTQRISSIGIRPLVALIAVFFVLAPIAANAQLTGIKTVGGAGDYSTLAAAITDLNLLGVGPGGVTFHIAAGHTETTTAVLEITATGVAGNPIIFQKSGAGANPLITRTDAGILATTSMSADGDAVIKVLGGDYITFDGLDVSATDQGIEYGYYLTKPSATDGCQNVTIQNCNITMTKGTSGVVVGILVGNGSTSVSAAAGLTVTALSGINSDILIKGNTISNVHAGIYLRGSSATGFYDNNITVGAPGAPNTIWNYGGGNTGVTYGVYLINQTNGNVSYNIIDNTAGGGVPATGGMYGIFHSTGTGSPFTANFNDINVTQGATSGILYGINTAATGNLTINNNNIALNTTATSSSIFGYIYNSSASASTSVSISNNTFMGGMTIMTTGTTYLIYNNSGQSSPGVTNITNNTISGTLTRGGASGTFYGYYNLASPTGTENIFNNNFSNIALAGSSTFYGVHSNTTANHTQNVYNNTISNIQGGTGVMYGLSFASANNRNVYGNEISNFTGGGTVYGISNGTGNGTNIHQNNIHNLTSTSTGTTAGLVTGILISSGNSMVYNNFISDLKAPYTAAVDGIRGIGITSSLASSTNKIYHNTIYLDASSSGTNFGTSGIFHTYNLTATTSVLDMRNNIVVNQSVPEGTGVTAAFRRSAATNLNNLSLGCNNNCFFTTGTGLVYFDGTNADATIGDFQTRVSPREALSFSAMPPFVNTASTPYNLRIQTTVSTMIESGGDLTAGILNDFDGNPRFGSVGYIGNGTAPDVGAFEFEGIPNYTCVTPVPGTTLASTNNICLGQSVILSLQNPTSGTGVNYQWKSSSDGITYTDITGEIGSTLTLIPNQPTHYLCEVTCQNGPVTVASVPVQITFSSSIATTTPATRCGVGTAVLQATTLGSGTIAWYDAPAGGVPIATGSPFTTPVISATTDFYVAEATFTPGVVTLGAGASASISVGQSFLPGGWGGAKTQYIIRASELLASGISAGAITSLGFNPTTSGQTYQGFYVSLGHTNNTTAPTSTTGFITSGLSRVYAGTEANDGFLPVANVVNTLVFGTGTGTVPAFVWDGTSNIVVSISWSRVPGATTATGSNMLVDNVGFVASAYRQRDNFTPAAMEAETAVNTTTSFRPMFHINGISVCSSPRVQVTATVTPAPILTISPDVTLCNDEVTAISVTSNIPDYDTYTWFPHNGLFTDMACTTPYVQNASATTVYYKTNVYGIYNFVCNASNVALCANQTDIDIQVLPTAPTIVADPEEICISGTTNLSIPVSTGYGAATFQWQNSTDNVIFTDITGATGMTYNTPMLTATEYFKLIIKNSNGLVCSQPEVMVLVNNPLILNTTPGTRCGIGTVNLEATANAGASISWYDAPSGGAPKATGTIFTTPVINTTTDYYVAASIGETIGQVGAPNTTISASIAAQTTTTAGINFQVDAPSVTIQSVDIYPTAAIGTPFTIFVRTGGTSGTIIASYSGVTTVQGSVANPQVQVVPVNFVLSQGTGYVMHLNPNPSTLRNSGGDAFPYTIPGVITLTSSTGSSWYYYMYNWTVKVGCSGPRTLVTATVTPPPALTVNATQTVCNDAPAMLQVTSNLGDFNLYEWTPATNLFLDAAGTIPYIAGTSATVLYAKTSTAGTTTYTCTATNTTSNCVNITTTDVTVKAPIVLVTSATPGTVCPGVDAQLNVAASQAGVAPGFTYLWTPTTFIPAGQETLPNPLVTAPTITTIYTVLVTNDGCTATGQVTVNVEAGSTIVTQPVANNSCVNGNATFSVVASGPGLTYQWQFNGVAIDGLLNPSALTPSLNLTGLTLAETGNYTVVVSALCGSPVTSAPAALMVYPIPVATAASNSPICQGTVLNLFGNSDPGATYSWTGPNGFVSMDQNPVITNAEVIASGNYYVTATVNGCASAPAMTPVIVNPYPSSILPVASNPVICPGGTTDLTVTGMSNSYTLANLLSPSGDGGFETGNDFLSNGWVVSNSANNPWVIGTAAIGAPFSGNAAYISNDGGLSNSYDNSMISLNFFYRDITVPANATNISLSFDWIGNGEGSWDLLQVFTAPTSVVPVGTTVYPGSGTTSVPTAISGATLVGFYQTQTTIQSAVHVLPNSLAGSTFRLIFSWKSDDLYGTNPSAAVDNISLTAQIANDPTYSWTSNPAGFVSSSQSITSVAPSQTTIYTVTLENAYGCTASEDLLVTVNPLPTATTTLNATEHICLGESILLTVDLTGTAPWTLTVDDGTGPIVVPGIMTSPWSYPVSPAVNTTYSVTQVQDFNCTNTSSLSVQVIVDPLPAPVVLTGVVTPLCANSTTTLNAGSGYTSYLWSDNSTAQTLLVDGNVLGGNATAPYSVTVTNMYGCEATASTIITTYPVFSANAGPDVAICEGLSTQLDANGIGGAGTYASYAWSPAAGLSATNIKNPVANPVVTTTYTVTIDDDNGCVVSDDVVVTVYPAVVVDFTGLNAAYCIDAPAALLTGSPAGGVFTGPGITGNTFDPVIAGVGGPYSITYTYTDGNNCVWITSKPVTVNPLPVVSFIGLNAAYCVDAASAMLSGSPTGGTFSGAGITANTFTPATAGVGGPYTIVYTYTDGNSCTNSTTQQVTVNPLPVVSFIGLNAAYCVDGPIVTLTGTPASGTFSGPGVSGNSFNPAIAGAGTHTIIYSYTDGNSCTNSESQTVTVNPLPVLTIDNVGAGYCIDVPAFTLFATPAGGTFSGTGVVAGMFDPSVAGAGTHTITYAYTDGNGCFNTVTQNTDVYALPVVNFAVLNDVCVDAAPVVLNQGTPAGGTYSGTGVAAGAFDPGVAGVGNHTLTYTYVDGNFCINSATQTIQVNALPTLAFPAISSVCITVPEFALNTATPAGGTYSGAGVMANMFNPTVAGAGVHTITYTYTDGNNCTNSITQTIEVFALPVLTMSADPTICAGFSAPIGVTATGAGGFTYAWDHAGLLNNASIANPTATPGTTTTFTVTVTDVNLCVNTGSVTVNVNQLPVIALGPDVDQCHGYTTQLNAVVTPAGSYTYAWSNAGSLTSATIANPLASPVVTTTYTVTVTNTATTCVNTAAIVVTVLPNPLPAITGLNANYCIDAVPVVLTGTPAGGIFTIAGNTVTTLDPSALGLGLHTVVYTVVNPNGCIASSSQTFTVRGLPTANAGVDQNTCAGLPVFLGATAMGGTAPYSYAWTPAGSLSNANIHNPIATTLVDETYTVTVTDFYGCQGTDQMTVFATAIPVANVSPDVAICIGQSTPLQASGGDVFSWSPTYGLSDPNSASPIASPVATTTYTVTVSSICGVATNSVVVTVNPLPAVIFIGLPTNICVDAPIQTLTGGPNGGTFAGPGMVGNHFNPALAGVGGPYNIVYTYTDGNGCTNSNTQPITVRPLPTLTISGLSAGYCLPAPAATLTVTPAGGMLSGPGIVGNTFDPALAGVGTHTITYTYTDGFNCTNSIAQVVRVDLPVSFTGLAPMYCNDNPIVTLTGIPAGGTFSGVGITGNTFNPAIVPLGNRTITYTMPQPYYCASSASQVTMINALPSAAFSGLNLVHGHCVSLTAVPLTGHPVGGVFTGAGITGNVFSPAMAGVGNHVITYTYADPNGCSKSVSQTVTVKPLPVVNFTGLAGPYCVNFGTVTLTGTPAGGTFSGPGITGNTFNTMLAGAGTHTITYSYTDNVNCANSISQTVVVNALPVVTLAPMAPVCAGAPQITLTSGLPAGGSYSGTGVLGNVFHPTIAGVGTHTITYTYTNPATGCTGTASVNMIIHPNPVANAGNDTSVFVGTKANLLGSATGGLGSYGYSWTPAALVMNSNVFSTQTANMTTSQVFTLTVTDLQTGCTATDQKIVNVVGSPLDVMVTGVPTTICQGGSSTLTAIATGGSTNYTVYSWSSVPAGSYLPNASITVSPAVTTVYKVKVYDGFNWDSAMVTINVNPTPAVAINPLPAGLCIGSAAITLTGTPAGGTFSGPGVIGNTFNPNFAGIGIHTLTYSYTSGAGCSNTTTASIQVHPAPGVTIGTTPPAVCVNAAPVTLTGTPAGGTFSGPGVTGTTFNPTVAGVGIKTITYTYTNANGCTNTATRSIAVNALPVVSILNLAPSYCVNGSTVTLLTNQQGGVFTGNGVGANTFSPVSAGVGVHPITYTYTDGNGCTNSTTQNVTVNALPTLAFTGLQTQYCVNAAPVTLAATPAGGTFSGIGVTGTSLNPSVVGVGTTTVTYSYTNAATGCSNTISANLNIRPLPVIGISVPNPNPCINGGTVTLTGSPAGGTFSGPGMTGNVFNPTTAGVGAKVITYTATNSFGCSSSGTTTIQVQALPTVTIGGLSTSYCLPTSQVVALAGFPAGGTFSGPGVSGNTFNPTAAGLGAKTVTYTYTNQYGCTNSTTANTTVNQTVANFTGLATSFCLNSAPVTLAGTPTGGIFTGAGISGSTFNPATAGVGGHNITYTVTNAATGCSGTITKYTVVHTLPNVSIQNLPANICINAAPYTVITSPATGGTLSGPGITGNQFNAATAGLGTKVITYSFTNANGCTVTSTQQITVQPLPTVSFTGLAGPYCESDPVVQLSGNPAGGTFSGNGIQGGGKFNPMTAQPGNHTITYTYTSQFGCVNTSSQPVTVYANPVVDLGPDTTICINHVITLDAGAGFNSYKWSTGATTQTIVVDAATLLPGWHHYTVTVTNANNCEASDRIRVIVLPCTGIEEPGDVTLLEVYPNPTTGIFNLTIHNAEATYQMDIYNDLGQIISKETLTTDRSARFNHTVDLSAHPTGMYFLRLQGERSTKVVKVVVN